MHEMNDGPKPPETDIKDYTDATPPSLACFSDEEQAQLGEAVHAVLHTRMGPPFLFELAMDHFVKLGAHKVGHGLQTMIWSAAQTMMLTHGHKGQDLTDIMVSVSPAKADATEADIAVCDMVQAFVEGTLAGAHQVAMDAWRDWVHTLGEDDWELYTDGVASLLQQAIELATGVLRDSEFGSAVLGKPAVEVVARDEKPREF